MKYQLLALILLATTIYNTVILPNNCSAEEPPPGVVIVGTPYQKIDAFVMPGDTHVGTISLHNPSEKEKSVTISVAPFSYELDQYGDYIQDFHTEKTRTALARWIQISGESTRIVPPGENINIGYSFTIPHDIISGNQSAVIFIQQVDDTTSPSDSGLGVQARAGYPVYINVSGTNIVESARASWQADSFLLAPPIRAKATIENTGNVSYRAETIFSVRNTIGNDLAFEDKQSFELLPETTLSTFHEWPSTPLLGLFNITETITYLDKVEIFTATVFIIPMWLLLLVIIAILLAIASIVFKIIKIRRTRTKISAHFEI